MDFAAVSPGDPLTPGVGATEGAPRLAIKDAKSITKIPVLPISYGDAQPLLQALGGPMAPVEWRGALPISYHVGPGPAKVHLKLAFNWDLKPVNNVIARIQGSEQPDQWVVRGNHHDAWVNGAEDPTSAMVVLLEEARAIGELVKQGFKPKRTIVFCAWDGEEPMLLGSTEWVEAHAAELREHAVAYINTDSSGRGYLGMGGSHTLERFVNDVARDIKDPETGLTVHERRRLRDLSSATARRSQGIARAARLANRCPGLRAPTSPPSSITWACPRSTSPSGAKTMAGSITRSTTTSTGTRISRTRTSPTARPWPRPWAPRCCGSPNADLLPFEFTGLADTTRMYLKELRALAEEQRDANRRA